ncbi:DUF3515 family protein [Microbacterium sp. ZW T5_45]|uniref:DUF3515 family protein n=1 Tax=Microbacterium sp. ZW T5_45 TaxID=3378080 RepID=UPI0038531A8A
MLRLRRPVIAAGAVALLALVSGCSTTVHLEPADAANDPACADVSVLVPDSVAGHDRVWTDAQATAAWGAPDIALRCGVAVPAPSELVCQTIGGVDWLVLAQEDERQRLVTYGRDPAVEVTIKRGLDIDFATVVDEISRSIQAGLTPATAKCTDRGEG